jgi:hypothetical protein
MLFAAVTHPVEGLSLETLLTLKFEKNLYNLLLGYTESKSIHWNNSFVLESVNKWSLKILLLGIKHFKM